MPSCRPVGGLAMSAKCGKKVIGVLEIEQEHGERDQEADWMGVEECRNIK